MSSSYSNEYKVVGYILYLFKFSLEGENGFILDLSKGREGTGSCCSSGSDPGSDLVLRPPLPLAFCCLLPPFLFLHPSSPHCPCPLSPYSHLLPVAILAPLWPGRGSNNGCVLPHSLICCPATASLPATVFPAALVGECK